MLTHVPLLLLLMLLLLLLFLLLLLIFLLLLLLLLLGKDNRPDSCFLFLQWGRNKIKGCGCSGSLVVYTMLLLLAPTFSSRAF